MTSESKTEATRFAKGKIYKLMSSVDDMTYVGSTCCTLERRKVQHKTSANGKNPSKAQQHFSKVGWANVVIVLLEAYPCSSRIELMRREAYWYDQVKPTLNVYRPAAVVNPDAKPYCKFPPPAPESKVMPVTIIGPDQRTCKVCGVEKDCYKFPFQTKWNSTGTRMLRYFQSTCNECK